MAEDVLIKIKQVNECNALAFVERETLPKHFKRSDHILFVKWENCFRTILNSLEWKFL